MLALLDELTETMKIAAPLAGIPLALMLPWANRQGNLAAWKSRLFMAAMAICALPSAVGTGSCVLGGFIQGSAFCSYRRRGVTWDPVADFFAIQTMYSFWFLLAAFLAVMAVLGLLPGKVTGWQRLLFLVTAGRRGAWRQAAAPALPPDPVAEKALAELRLRIERETDPTRKAEWVAAEATVRTLQEKEVLFAQELEEAKRRIDQHNRSAKSVAWFVAVASSLVSLGFLFPVIVGALTQEIVSSRGRAVALEAEPAYFWFTMGASLTLSILAAWLAIGCVRFVRSYRGFDRHDPENQGVLVEVGRMLGGRR